MAITSNSQFEIPPDMRQFAERSVEQAKAAFDGFMTAAQNAASTMEGRAAAAQASAKDVGQRAMSFAEINVRASFDFAQKLVRAKDMQELMAIQAEYLRAQMSALTAQAKELGETATKAATEAVKPPKL